MQRDSRYLADLLRRVARFGDREAFAALYDASSAKLFGIILRITREQARAEEVAQDVYVKIWRNASRFDEKRASPITWMATIARNTAIDEVRRRSREVATTSADADLNAIADEGPAQDTALETQEAREALERCLETLGSPQVEIVKLAYLEGLSREEISARFKVPIGTVKTWLHRSLKRLKECLSK